MPHRRPSGYGRVLAGLSVSATVAVVFVLTTVSPKFPNIGLFAGSADLHVYRDGGWRVRVGLPLYDGPVLFEHLYTYTPFSAIIFVPVERIPGAWVDQFWMATNMVLLVICIALCWRILGRKLTPSLWAVSVLLALTCVFLEPIRTTLFYGQINIVLMLLVLWDLSRADSSRVRGIGVGLAAAIKLTPAYFVVMAVALRQWRAATVAAATFVASILLGLIIIPSDSRTYWTDTFFRSTRVADPMHAANQSLRGALGHLNGHPVPVWIWALFAGCVGLLSLVVSVKLFRAGERLLAIALCGITSAVVSPFSWSHHWIWLVPLVVCITHRAIDRPRWWLAAVPIFVCAGSWPYQYKADWKVVGLFMYPPSWPIAQILMNIYLIVFVGILGALTWMVWRPSRRRAQADSRPPGTRRCNPFAPAPPPALGLAPGTNRR